MLNDYVQRSNPSAEQENASIDRDLAEPFEDDNAISIVILGCTDRLRCEQDDETSQADVERYCQFGSTEQGHKEPTPDFQCHEQRGNKTHIIRATVDTIPPITFICFSVLSYESWSLSSSVATFWKYIFLNLSVCKPMLSSCGGELLNYTTLSGEVKRNSQTVSCCVQYQPDKDDCLF